jgi:hypothetical protein
MWSRKTLAQRLRQSRAIHFFDWRPTGFNIGINHQPPTIVPGEDRANVIALFACWPTIRFP